MKLTFLDIFAGPVSPTITPASKTDPSTTPSDLDVYIRLTERSWYSLQAGTDVTGGGEAGGHLRGQLRNIFGGAESLTLNAATGTRTRAAYEAVFDSPILSHPDFRWQLRGVTNALQKTWASHEEVQQGGSTKLMWRTKSGSLHSIGYEGIWRQITGLGEKASPTIRGDAGDSFKSSLEHMWMKDRRDNVLLPSKGYYMRVLSEVAGFGPLKGDVAFFKSQLESQAVLPIPIPGIPGESGVTVTAGLRGGLLYPLTLAGQQSPMPSRINDRFQLGGPTDIRGFRLSGLGPRDGSDAVGGDVFAAGSANLLVPLPRLGKESGLRMQAFLTGGRLLALPGAGKEGSLTSDGVRENMRSTLKELQNGLPSTSAGVGLVWASQLGRFELNFSLPLVIRSGEEARKGLSFGIGLNFL